MVIRSALPAGLVDVPVPSLSIERYASVLTDEQMEGVREHTERARAVLAERTVYNINSTAKGGGVAEMLTALLPYACGAGVDARWLVIEGDPEFFRITKRLHNHLHGADGDSPALTAEDRAHYEGLLVSRAAALRQVLRPHDIVVLHDPQTAGLIPMLMEHCSAVVWRCHVGVDTPNDRVRAAWKFLLPYVTKATELIFSRRQFVWDGLDELRVLIIPPSIDPFSAKNREMDGSAIHAILVAAGLTQDGDGTGAEFVRQDGSSGRVVRIADMCEERPITRDTHLVLQVSRWDRLKDPIGVLEGFRRVVVPNSPAELMLAGPSVADVADDPEGQEVYAEVVQAMRAMPAEARVRVHLASLPMDDEEENAAMVNALQRRADVVVQKSLAEGFGLTVAEAMWKSRPVVGSAVGGIQDQIEDGVSGILLRDPRDLDTFGRDVTDLITHPERARAMGEAAHGRARAHFLGTRSLMQYAELLGRLTEPRS